MSRRRPGPEVGTAEWRERDAEGVRRSWELVRNAARILPADVRARRSRTGPFKPALKHERDRLGAGVRAGRLEGRAGPGAAPRVSGAAMIAR